MAGIATETAQSIGVNILILAMTTGTMHARDHRRCRRQMERSRLAVSHHGKVPCQVCRRTLVPQARAKAEQK
jgi:hypothetical protein